MATQIIKTKDRSEWLQYRNSGIGSSEIATIVGLNIYETPYQLWRRKLGMDAPKNETFAMKAGHYLEDAVSQFWMDETGKEVIKSSAGDWLIRNTAKEYLQVSPDRTYWLDGKRNKGNKGILECKTTQKTIDADDLPKHWFCQLQYQLGVAEMECGSLAWLCAGREFGYKEMQFVPDFYNWLVEEAEKFWVDNIQGLKEPAAVNVADVLVKYSKHTDGKILEVTEETKNDCDMLKALKDEIKALEEQKASIEDKIKTVICDAEAISYNGQTLATWKAAKDTVKFDTNKFIEDHPEMAAGYMKDIKGTRRFILK